MKKLGIIGAMDVEVQTLKEKLQDLQISEKAGMVFYQGMLENMPAVVVQCGVGKVNAALCVQILCDLFGVTHLVNTGVAGSLCNDLDIGDFVISQDAMYHDFTCHILNPAYCVGQVPGMDDCSIRKHHFHIPDLIAHDSIFDGSGAACIRSRHP